MSRLANASWAYRVQTLLVYLVHQVSELGVSGVCDQNGAAGKAVPSRTGGTKEHI